jgi:integrase/recombinase XerD
MTTEQSLIQADLTLPDNWRAVEWDPMITSFLDTMRAASTRRTYEPTLRTLALELGTMGPAHVSAQELAAWARGVRDAVESGAISPNTGKRRVMAVKSFFKFARTVGQSTLSKDLRAMVLQAPSDQVVKPFQVLATDEQDRLLAAVYGQKRQIVAALLFSGVRASELVKLRKRDYYTDEGGRRWLNVQGKGGKSRPVPVGDKLASELGPTNGGDDGPLFVGRQGSYTRVRVFQIVKAAVATAGIDKRISPHSLRHTAAITWLRSGVPVTVVQKWLGHSSLATTQKYLDHLENGEAHTFMP